MLRKIIAIRRTINNIHHEKIFIYNLSKDTIMKTIYMFMPIVILSIVLISQVYAQSSNNTLKDMFGYIHEKV